MAFTRKFLTDHGVPEEQIDAIMAERNRTLKDYVPIDDVQAQIDAALTEAAKNYQPTPIKVEETDEYKALAAELAMTRALGGEDFAIVKPKFRETVYKMLDHGEKHKPYAEQLTEVAKNYEEYFTAAETKPDNKPAFGAPVQGKMPSGEQGKSFNAVWNFPNKTN